MDRRGFLSAILVGACAPAIVRASSLMKIVRPSLVEIAKYNGLLTIDMITAEALRILEIDLVSRNVAKANYAMTNNMMLAFNGVVRSWSVGPVRLERFAHG